MRRFYFLVICLGLTTAAHADIILDTYGQWGNGINNTAEYGVYQNRHAWGSTPALPFISPGEFALSSIELPLSIQDLNDQMFIRLRTDIGGLPGDLLESFLLTNTTGFEQRDEIDYTFDSVSHPVMHAGQSCEPVDVRTDGYWYTNSDFTTYPMLMSHDDGATWVQFDGSAAVRISATAVPEPASIFTLGLGALALIRRRKLNRVILKR